MNTLSRIDALFTILLNPTPSPSLIPPPTPLAFETKGLQYPNTLYTRRPTSSPVGTGIQDPSRLSPPPTPRRRKSLKRRRKATSASSVKLPPPSTPFFLRIALGLWSILLAFWVSLVGETRAERGRRRTQRRIGSKSKSVFQIGLSSDEGSGTEVEVLPGGSGIDGEGVELGEVTETDADDGDWVDPVTRAPEGFADGVVDQPDESEFTRQSQGDGFTFRLPSAGKRNNGHTSTEDNSAFDGSQVMDLRVNPPTPEKIYNLRSSTGTPTGILSNPLPVTAASRARSTLTPTPPRAARLLPNPMITSLLDPSVSLSASRQPAKSPAPAPHIRPHLTPFHLRKTLILDLDETLIHSTSRPLGYSTSGGGGMLGISLGGLLGGRKSRREGHTVEVVLRGRSTTYHVYKRPYVDHFLKKAASWYTLVIYTASMPEYADPVIDWLDAGRSLFAKRLYRDSCFLQSNGSYIKDLALVETDLSRVCFMDNSPISYSWNKANALPIEGWTSDPYDEALLQSLPVLDCLRFVNDVRRVLGIRGFT